MDPFLHYPHPWSAYHSDDYGYTRMHIANSTHLYLEQVSVEQVRQMPFDFRSIVLGLFLTTINISIVLRHVIIVPACLPELCARITNNLVLVCYVLFRRAR